MNSIEIVKYRIHLAWMLKMPSLLKSFKTFKMKYVRPICILGFSGTL